MYSIGELKPGMLIILEGDPCLVVAAQHSKQARQGGVTKTKIKNLISGSITNKTFQGNDKLTPADVNYAKAQFLYSDGENYNFMDSSSFDQFAIDAESLGEQVDFLVDGMELDIQYFENKPISVKLPPKVDLTVTHTDPGVKGDTASGGSKPATLETGYVLQVPLFIDVNDKIRVNTDTGEYVERA